MMRLETSNWRFWGGSQQASRSMANAHGFAMELIRAQWSNRCLRQMCKVNRQSTCRKNPDWQICANSYLYVCISPSARRPVYDNNPSYCLQAVPVVSALTVIDRTNQAAYTDGH
jgi:hypothetical protein